MSTAPMAMATKLPLRYAAFPRTYLPISVRHYATRPVKPAARKPLTLEKPSKFTPPSHPSRLPRRAARASALPTYGLSDKEKEESKVKRYPHMMPPEGTFLHWFLTNRSIHVWITMSILTSLAFFTWLTNFLTSTPYKDQLPPNNFFFSHPFAFIRQYIEVYHLHTEYISAQTAERRRNTVEDVRKRSEYRKAHGLDGAAGEGGSGEGFMNKLGGWTVKKDDEVLGPGMREGGDLLGLDASPVAPLAMAGADQPGSDQTDHVSSESKPKKQVKKWLGIW